MCTTAARVGRAMAAGFLALLGIFLAWQFAVSAPHWGNGWMEGASYALGAPLLFALAVLVERRGRPSWVYGCCALLVALLGAWFVRWTVWLLVVAPGIGPHPPFLPLVFAVAAVLFWTAAGLVARRALRPAP